MKRKLISVPPSTPPFLSFPLLTLSFSTSVMLKLVLSSSMEAMLEATRVYGNLSQSKDVRDFIMQNKGIYDGYKHQRTGCVQNSILICYLVR